MSEFPEADWQVLRSVHDEALEKMCERILAEVIEAGTKPGLTYRQRYLDVYSLVKERDKDVANTFNNWRRSWALITLRFMLKHDLLSAADIARFSEVTRATALS